MRKTICLLLAGLVLSLTAASAQTGKGKPGPRRAKVASAAVTTPSGLTYIITKRGAGRLPKTGENVAVHYTGTLTNGVKFDSSRDGDGQPIVFKLGAGRVIKGWDEGIAKLPVGSQAVLIIPPALAYGAKGAGEGLIPSQATLVFIVELVEVRAPVARAGNATKSRGEKGGFSTRR
jgi:peptidylprolyl isomerase